MMLTGLFGIVIAIGLLLLFNISHKNSLHGKYRETHAVKTHFWLENILKDKSDKEHFQDNKLINLKLWQKTKWVNLIQVETEFPEIQWGYL